MEKINRNKLKANLTEGKKLEQDLITNYKDNIPERILNGAIDLFNNDVPKRINILIGILNSVEKEKKYNEVNHIDEVIAFLDNDEVEGSIKLALNEENLLYFSPIKEQNLNFEDMLENLIYAINSNIEQLYSVLAIGKLKK